MADHRPSFHPSAVPAFLTIRDETASGQTLHTFTLADLTERLTVRERFSDKTCRWTASIFLKS